MLNIVSKLFEVTRQTGNRPALIFGHRRKAQQISYSNFLRNVSNRAEELARNGMTAGDRVLLFAPFSIRLFEYMMALFWIGAVAVFVDNWSSRKRLEEAVRVTQPAIFAGSWKAQLLRFFSTSIRRIPRKLLIRTAPNRPGSLIGGDQIVDDIFAPIQVAHDHAALITLTTGSTGTPKAALRTHAFLLAQHEVLSRHLQTDASEIAWTTLPVFVLHFLGAGCTCILPPGAGGDPDDLDIAQALTQIVERNATTILTSPSILDRLSDVVRSANQNTMVTKIFVGGAPVFRNDAEKYAMAFPTATITILYGSTEAEPISAIGIGDFLALEASVEGLPVGPPIGEIRVKIWPEKQDASLEPLVGEICVTGDHVLKAYYKSPEEFARNKFEEDGELWHRTGDAGYLDAHGNLVLMGRMSRRFVRDASASPTMLSTMRVAYYPIAVEKKLRSIPGITTGTILQSGGRGHERSCVVAFVEKDSRMMDHARNLELKSRVLELFPFLDEVRVLTTPLPRDPRHRSKIDYEKLESLIANV